MTARRRALPALLLAAFALFAASNAHAQVSITTPGTPYTQNFDTLPASGAATWTNNSTIPGWFHARTGTGTTIVANNGSSNAGNLYSYGCTDALAPCNVPPNATTDRALGSVGSGNAAVGNLFWGVRLQNNTGSTITQLDISYTGEQWRNSAAAAQTVAFSYLVGSPTVTGSLAEFQSAGVAVAALDFTSPITGGTAGSLNGNLAANRTTKTFSITGLSIPNGTEIMLRWSDPDHTGADHGLSIDDFSVTVPGGPPPLPTLNISDVTLGEGDPPGTTTFTFAVTLSAPAGPGGVTFDIATADGSAQDDNPVAEDNDYVAQSLTGQNIPMGSTGPYNFNVTVNRDTTSEANETFFVNVTNIVGATAGDAQGQGTINNDDVTVIFIHDVQGNGTSSPLAGSSVTIQGIVTLLKSNGFFLQEEVGDSDADPNTSEGIFVFTSSAPTVGVGDNATVTGTVVEFNGLTEISPVSNLTINSTGNPLPTAVTLTPADLPPTANVTQPQLEKYEGMRVTAASLTTVAPNDNFFDVETVLTGEPRPMREPGIPVSDPIPPDPTSGLPDCCIPIWDENPERLNVDTNGRAGSTGETLTSNVTLTSVTGPLDFSFGRYRLINEANLTRTANMSAVPVPLPAANEFTIAGYNIENFNNNATQRQKAALTVRDVLRLPDIIGTVEIFDLADLQALANEIQTISGVTYSAHLIEQDGTSEDNDQDVGYLVKTSRVSVTSVTQERASETYINPITSSPETLHDRPPLVLTATVDPSGPSPQPVIVVVNHLRSFIDIELVAGEGVRVREKRKKQAESLADLLNDLQTANPGTPVISVGDYNAFQFNSGYDDSISVIRGAPTPDDQIVVDQSPDLVNPDFLNLLLNVPADQRYTFIFEGTPQALDHVLANTVAQAINTGIAVARVNADFPSVPASAFASDATRPEANSDHDPLVAYFLLPASADVSVTKADNVDPVNAGQNFFYTITVDNAGPDPADTVSWSDALPAGTTFVSLSQPGGWTCTTPAVGANGTVTCSIASLGVGSAAFNITVAVNAGLASGTVLSNTATVTTTTSDPNGANNSDTETTTVATSADLLLSKTDSPDPVNAGSNLSYTITLTNNGPSNANATFTDTLPAGTTFVSLSTTGPWTCTTPAVGATGTVTCTNASFLVTVDFFTLVVNVDPTVATGTVLSNTATLSSSTPDPNGANNSGTATTTVATSADVSVTKTDSPDPVNAGSNITYTITVNNAGPSNAADVTLTDILPLGTTFVSLSSPPSWTCTIFPVVGGDTLSCGIASMPPGGVVFTLTAAVLPATPAGTIITNTAQITSTTPDPVEPNRTSTATTTVATLADVQVTKTDAPDPVTAGTNLTYTITVTNPGPSDAATVTLADTVPANTTFVSLAQPGGWSCTTPPAGGTGAINCSIATFPAGGNAVFTLVVNTSAALANGAMLTNTATVATTTPESSTANNTATATTTVGTGSADVSVTKTDSPDPVNAGSNVTYTITVTNAGPSAATTAALSDTLPAGTTFVSLAAPAGWTCTTPAPGATGTINCSNPTLGVTSAVFTLVVNVDPALLAGNVLSNTATATSATTDPNGANNSDTETTTVTASADLLLSKTDTPDPVNAGSNISYQITLTNNGPSNAAAASFSDPLPAGTTFVSLSTTGPWTCTTPAVGATGTVACTNPSFGVTVDFFTIVVQTNAGLSSGTVITNTATLASTTTDPNGANNSATATTTIGVGSADVSITKVDTPDPVNAGADITYTITVTNAGPTNAASAAMSDTLPTGTTFVSLSAPAGWTCVTPAVGAAGTVSCTNPSLGSGSSMFSLVVRVAAVTTPGTVITNTATVTSATADPNVGNESATATTSVVSPANVSGTKTVTGTFAPGSPVTYTIVLTNSGPSTQQNNPGDELVDVLPASLILVSASATSGTAVANVGTNTVTWNGSIAAGASVTITINATIRPDATPGTSVSNQATINYDADGNGTNESSRQTDSPAAGGTSDPTLFTVGAAALAAIPTLDELALLALAALLATVAALMLKR